MLKKTIISFALIGAVALAVASSGGGKKKSDAPHKPEFTPIRTTNGFTLKAGPVYSGSSIRSTERNANSITYNTLVTYQKGSSVIILPHQSRMSTNANTKMSTFKSNLNFLDLKFRLRLHK